MPCSLEHQSLGRWLRLHQPQQQQQQVVAGVGQVQRQEQVVAGHLVLLAVAQLLVQVAVQPQLQVTQGHHLCRQGRGTRQASPLPAVL
jgi:hypothetical protein